jgi:cell division protein FtsB
MISINDPNDSIGLIQALITIIPTCLITLIGIKRMFKKKSTIDKYMILTRREVKNPLNTEIYELTNDEQIRQLIDEKEDLKKEIEDLKNKNDILKKEYKSLNLKYLILAFAILCAFILNKIFSKKTEMTNELENQ